MGFGAPNGDFVTVRLSENNLFKATGQVQVHLLGCPYCDLESSLFMPVELPSWKESLSVYAEPAVRVMLLLGFAAGLPLLLVFSTLSAWLSDAGVSRTEIGFFAWVGITYSIKVFWAPVIDRTPLPWLTARLGQRRGWMLVGQLGVIAGLMGMASIDPADALVVTAACAVLVAFSSATQDVALDAFRIESAQQQFQGALSSAYILGYRVAMLVSGAGAFYLSAFFSWHVAYLAMAALMSVGVLTVLFAPEPIRAQATAKSEGDFCFRRWFIGAVVEPFSDFFLRYRHQALLILLFISVYRLSDIVMGIMANPFYLEMGYSKTDIASIGKLYGFLMTIAGSFVGGLLVVRYGVAKPLLLGALMVAATNVLFAIMTVSEPSLTWLAVVISADNLSAGLANASFVAYLSGLTNRQYTATQYALFSSLMTLPGKFVSGFSGVVVDQVGYLSFFLYSAAMGIPAILLAIWMLRRQTSR